MSAEDKDCEKESQPAVIHTEPELEETPPGEDEMSLVGHLEELRRRILIILGAVAIGSGICYLYAEELVAMITAPAGKLYYLNPMEAFFAYLKVSVFAGFLLALPVVLYQVWAFVVPALTQKERKLLLVLLPSSVLLFFVGVLFSYFLVLPAATQFFMGFATETLTPMFSLGQYLSFFVSMLLPFGFVFELPLFVIVLAKMGIITSDFLRAKRKVVLVGSFIVGAIISPTPDVFTQSMIAIPIILLYEASLWVVRYILRR